MANNIHSHISTISITMNVEQIEKLDEIFPLDEDTKIINQKVTRLTAKGENYGSLMLSVDIILQSPSGTEAVHAVAKMIPPNDFLQKIFNTQQTFKNEIAFYSRIVPALHAFQTEQGMENLVEFFPRYYGGRINLNDESDVVDSDAVLLLENLKISGYKNFERTEGFDLDASKLILEDLAHLHAVPLGLKLQQPEVFKEEIQKYLNAFPKVNMDEFKERFFRVVDTIDQCKLFKRRIQKAFEIHQEQEEPREPWATVIHNDCWVNNTMLKVQRAKPVDNKLVDFQVLTYGSPAQDVLFFLFSSVMNHVLEKNFDILVQHYHKTFSSILKQLHCETARFSYEAFNREMSFQAKNSEFLHILFMTWPIFTPRNSVKELSELTFQDMFPGGLDITDVHREKIIFIIKQFAKKNWI